MPVASAVSTLEGEDLAWVLTWATPIELTTFALFDRFRHVGPGASWCVVVDGSHLGRRVAAAARAAGAAEETSPVMLDLDVGEIELLDLDASVVHLSDAVADRQCPYVLVEVAEARAVAVLEQLQPNLTVVRRGALAADLVLPSQVELFVDSAPPWMAGTSAVMDAFAADWASFAPDARPNASARAGWLSQLRLHALLEAAVAAGDLSRERLGALAKHVELVDPDRNTLPGASRIGMDISESVGGGPMRTLRLFGRSDVGADALGLRQVLAADVSGLLGDLHERLGAAP